MSRADQAGRADDDGRDDVDGPAGGRRGDAALEVRRDEVERPPHAGAETGAGAVTTLRAAGELDAATATRLLEALTDTLATGATTRSTAAPEAGGGIVLLDLEAVGFCDSRGLSTLVAATRAAARAGTSLRLLATEDSAVARLLARTGMTGLLPLHRDVVSALAGGAASPLEREVEPDSR